MIQHLQERFSEFACKRPEQVDELAEEVSFHLGKFCVEEIIS